MPRKKTHGSDFDLVARIYDAALNPELWPEFIEDFADRIDATAGVLAFHNTKAKDLSFIMSFGRNEDLFKEYSEYFVKINPYIEPIKNVPNFVYSTQTLLEERELVKTEYYNDWLRPQDIHYNAGTIIYRDSARAAVIDMQRPKDMGAFGKDELKHIELFEPHLTRAFQINQKFWNLLADSEAAHTVLDNLQIGVIFIDEDERPIYLNRKAEELTKFGDGVVVKGEKLSAAWHEQTKSLQKLVYQAVQTGMGKGLHPGGTIRVGILEDSPHFVLVSPFSNNKNDLGFTGKRICAAVFISSPYAPYAVSVESVKNLFGLTTAEAKLAGELVNGLSVDEIADKFDISRNTARDRLNAVLSKTGTRRQAELIKFIRSSPDSVISEGVLLGDGLGGPLERRHSMERRKRPHLVSSASH